MVKDKTYDLGELGKWSKSTLEGNKRSTNYATRDEYGYNYYQSDIRIVEPIEILRKKLLKELNEEKKKLDKIKVKKLKLSELYRELEGFKVLEDRRDKLAVDYKKYQNLVNPIKKGK